MQGVSQIEIAVKTGMSRITVNNWVKNGGWESKRAGLNITRPELVNKLLRSINSLLDETVENKNTGELAGLPDKLAKFASVIEKLEKKTNIVDTIEVFMAFSKWLQYRQSFDKEITPELIKTINRLQDLYITENVSK
jgi:transcriptional regulator with XRE-family HTH domain